MDDLIKNGDVLLEFYADWCGVCRSLSLEIEKIEDKINVLRVDVDKHRNMAKKFGVMTLPTLVYVKKDGNYNKNVGFISSDDILKFIKL